MVLDCFLNGKDAKTDTYGLEVGTVNGGWLGWGVGKVASGVDGSAGNFIGDANLVMCEVVDVVETAIVCFCGGGIVVPGCGIPEDAVECGSRCEWDGDVEGEVNLAVRETRCPVIG